jgi:hypothetical protein
MISSSADRDLHYVYHGVLFMLSLGLIDLGPVRLRFLAKKESYIERHGPDSRAERS